MVKDAVAGRATPRWGDGYRAAMTIYLSPRLYGAVHGRGAQARIRRGAILSARAFEGRRQCPLQMQALVLDAFGRAIPANPTVSPF